MVTFSHEGKEALSYLVSFFEKFEEDIEGSIFCSLRKIAAADFNDTDLTNLLYLCADTSIRLAFDAGLQAHLDFGSCRLMLKAPDKETDRSVSGFLSMVRCVADDIQKCFVIQQQGDEIVLYPKSVTPSAVLIH